MPSLSRRAAVLIVLALGTQAAAQKGITAGELLERHVAFLGGRELLEQIKGLEIEAEMAGPVGKTFARFLVRRDPFGYREEWRFPGRENAPTVYVSDGRHAWQWAGEDRPGVLLRGLQARALLERAFFEGLLYLSASPENVWVGKPMELGGWPDLPAEVPASPTVIPVEFRLPAGSSVHAFFDAADARLHALVEAVSGGGRWLRLGGWEKWEGLQVPGVRVNGQGPRPGLAEALRVTKVRIAAALPERLFAGRPVPALPETVAAGPVVLRRTAVPGWARLFLPGVRFNRGPPVPCLLDTGATGIVLDPGPANALRLPVLAAFEFTAAVGKGSGTQRWLDELALDRWRFHQLVIDSVPMPRLEDGSRPYGAILGGRHVMEASPVLDLRSGVLHLRGRPVKPLGHDVPALPFRWTGKGRFAVEARLHGRPLSLLVDTGAPAPLVLHPRGLRKAGLPVEPAAWKERGALPMPVSSLGGGKREDSLVRLDGFELGPLRYESVWAAIAWLRKGQDGAYDFDGLLGLGAFLPLARVGIDAEHTRLELDAGEKPAERIMVPAARPFLGVSFGDGPRGPVVRAVCPETPAARAGIERGDRLLAVNGKPIKSTPAGEVNHQLWLEPGDTITLTLERESREVPLSVRLRAPEAR